MLGENDAIPDLAVKDLEVARRFYADKLGLKPAGMEDDQMIMFQSGNSRVNVYTSYFAGTNQATAVTWAVADVHAEVASLKAKGITFEHYDMPGVTRRDDVHLTGSSKAAWFKDPDGNIIALVGT